MHYDGNVIARTVIECFQRLPRSAWPRVHPNGSREWVPLSGIVIRKNSGAYKCVALGTGMRCLPASKIPLANGRCLHDWHAEVVAIRAFNSYLLTECSLLATSPGTTSDVVRRRGPDELHSENFQPFAVQDDIDIFMYCSEAPCGDASMELTMAAQASDAPWDLPVANSGPQPMLPGRSFFSELGTVRRKPARADAPPTLSKSCSDKLALKQCTSLLSAVGYLLIHPSNVYINTLVLPQSQYVAEAFERSFSPTGRMKALAQHDESSQTNCLKRWSGGFRYSPFDVTTTTIEFEYCRRHALPADKPTGTNIAAMWTPYAQEVLINGTIQGNKQFSTRGSSKISRLKQWELAKQIIEKDTGSPPVQESLMAETYRDLKQACHLALRENVKADVKSASLKGWVRNTGDDSFQCSTSI